MRKAGNKRKLYAVYDTENSGICCGFLTAWQIAEQYNVEPQTVKKIVCRGTLLHKRYEILPTEWFEGDEEVASE